MFWLVMTAIASAGSILYIVIGRPGGPFTISPETRMKFHTSGILMIGWAFLCYAHFLLAH